MVFLIAAVPRLFDPRPFEEIGIGLAIVAGVSVINLAVARVLLRGSAPRLVGHRHELAKFQADYSDLSASTGLTAAARRAGR